MGRFSRSWELVEQSFAILWADKQLMLFPVLSGISCVIVSLLLGLSGLAVFLPALRAAGINQHNFQHFSKSPEFAAAMFVLYLANYFVIVFFNVALVGVANSRLTGGAWTFDQGLQLAWQRKWVILQWAFVAATVGVALRMLSERASFIGRIVRRIRFQRFAYAAVHFHLSGRQEHEQRDKPLIPDEVLSFTFLRRREPLRFAKIDCRASVHTQDASEA